MCIFHRVTMFFHCMIEASVDHCKLRSRLMVAAVGSLRFGLELDQQIIN